MAERKQNGKKETKHVNNAESKNQKNKLKIRQKKGRRHSPTGVWAWKLKNTEKQTKHFKADGGWDEDGPKHASESQVGVHTLDM